MDLLTRLRTMACTWGAPENEKKQSFEEMDELGVDIIVKTNALRSIVFHCSLLEAGKLISWIGFLIYIY